MRRLPLEQRRLEPVTGYLTPGEKARFDRMAKALGVKRASFVREVVLAEMERREHELSEAAS
jgi:hypothetical protein